MERLETARRLADRALDTIWDGPADGWRGTLGLAARVAAPLALFVVLDRWLARSTALPEAAYRGPVILLSWLRSLGVVQGLALAVLAALVGWVGRDRLGRGWSALEGGAVIRVLVGVVAAALAWWYATLDVNPYFDRLHLIDRLLMAGGALLIVWRPAFVLPFLLVLLPFNAQFHHPLGEHSVAQISLPSHLLLLFAAAHLVWVVTGRRTMASFVLLTFCLVAASYVVPGLAKIRLGWVGHRHVYLMLFSSYTVGWLGFLEPATVTRLAEVMELLDWPVVIATLVIEVGAVVILWRRRAALAWLAGFVALNTLIWVTSGIFFWTWIVTNATLLALLWRRPDEPVFQVFGARSLALSIPVILAGSFFFRPARLAWLDAPATYTYRLEATTESGARFDVPTALLAPYDTHFALANFGRLADAPQLGIAWGAAYDLEMATELLEARTAEDVFGVERAWGTNQFDPERAARFDDFVRAVVTRYDRGADGRFPVRWLKAPRQVWTFHPDAPAAWPSGDPVASVTVYQVLTFYDGEQYRVIRRVPVREIGIEPMADGARG